MSDRRIVTKRPDETFRCEKCARSFSELHYLTRHKREEHGPRVYCRHCNASFPQCRSFQLRDHEKRCQEKSYHPRGRILRERESRGRSQSPRVQRGTRRPRSRSPKAERYDKFARSSDFSRHSTKTSRSPSRHTETRKLPAEATSMKTDQSTDPAQKPDDLPASPQLQVDLTNESFSTSVEATDDPFTQPDSSIVNLFTNLDLETSNATYNLENINNNSLSEEPFQPFSYNIFQTDQSSNLPMNFLLDQNHNLICLTPFSASNHLMDTTDDMLPPPPPPEAKTATESTETELPLPPAPETDFLEMPDFSEPLPPPPTDDNEQTSTDSTTDAWDNLDFYTAVTDVTTMATSATDSTTTTSATGTVTTTTTSMTDSMTTTTSLTESAKTTTSATDNVTDVTTMATSATDSTRTSLTTTSATDNVTDVTTMATSATDSTRTSLTMTSATDSVITTTSMTDSTTTTSSLTKSVTTTTSATDRLTTMTSATDSAMMTLGVTNSTITTNLTKCTTTTSYATGSMTTTSDAMESTMTTTSETDSATTVIDVTSTYSTTAMTTSLTDSMTTTSYATDSTMTTSDASESATTTTSLTDCTTSTTSTADCTTTTTSSIDSVTPSTHTSDSQMTTAVQTPSRRISLKTYRLRALRTTTTAASTSTIIGTGTTDSTVMTTREDSMDDNLPKNDTNDDTASISSYTCSRGSSCSDCSSCTDRSHRQTTIDDDYEPLSPPAKRRRLEYDPLLSSTNNYEPLYSLTMPLYSPEPATYRPTTINKDLPDGPTFPPRPINIPTNTGNDRYAYLSHDPRTVFAGAPSSFFKSPDARYASRMRKRALQIGVKPENMRYTIDGHILTKREIVNHKDFHYELTTFSPLPTSKKLKDRSCQTDRQQRRCTEDCPGCGNTFTFTCI